MKSWLILSSLLVGGIAGHLVLKRIRVFIASEEAKQSVRTEPQEDNGKSKSIEEEFAREDNNLLPMETDSEDLIKTGQLGNDLFIDDDQDKKGKQIPKEKIPARRGSIGGTETSREKESLETPQIVCWRKEGHWAFGVQLEDLPVGGELSVTQGGSTLPRETVGDLYRFPFSSLSEEVEIQYGESKIKVPVQRFSVNLCLVFKTRENWEVTGRHVRRVSNGHYLMVAPSYFQRDVERSGEAPVEPEKTHLPNYRIHYFFVEREEPRALSFILPTGARLSTEVSANRFILDGKRLELDVSIDKGPMFLGDTPILRDNSETSWEDVEIVVLGEEGRGVGKWREGIYPREFNGDIPLSDLEGRGPGWYFLRIYNLDGELIETFDFRYANILRDVRVVSSGPFPSETGHRAAELIFQHDRGIKISPCNERIASISSDDKKSVFQIAPHPDLDLTRWNIYGQNEEDPIELNIALSRAWWGIGVGETQPAEWVDQQIRFDLDDFQATSEKSFCVSFKGSRGSSLASVGFAIERMRDMRIFPGGGVCNIPLRDFCDDMALGLVGESELRCRLGPLPDFTDLVVGVISKFYGCVFCKNLSSSENDALRHFNSVHRSEIRNFFPHVDYQEMRMRDVTLPTGIYKCGYCYFFVPSDKPPLNPTSSMFSHIDNDCQGVDRNVLFRRPRFFVEDDVDIIRREVLHNLPRIHKCIICANRYINPMDSDFHTHLISSHRNALFELRAQKYSTS